MRRLLLVLALAGCTAATDAPAGLTLASLEGAWVMREWRFVGTVDPAHVQVVVPGPVVIRGAATLLAPELLHLDRWADTVALQRQTWVSPPGPVDTVQVWIEGSGVGRYVLAHHGDTLTVRSAGGWPCFPFPTGCEPATETQVWLRP